MMSLKYDLTRFKDGLDKFNIPADDLILRRFIDYYEMLVDWNEKMNLTSITEFDEVIVKHFLDSLSLLDYFPIPENAAIIDIGTGAGFPGLPLKIVRPDLKVMLVDSLNKRIVFLNEVIGKLGLDDISALHGRAEDLGHDQAFREQYDFCISRAVADLSVLCEYALPFVRVGGYFISYKSGQVEEELDSAKGAIVKLSASVDRIERFLLPGSDISRSFVIISKDSPIDERYPRSAARIKKNRLT